MRSLQTLSEVDRRVVAVWAADCAERVLGLLVAEAPDDVRPEELIASARGSSPSPSDQISPRSDFAHLSVSVAGRATSATRADRRNGVSSRLGSLHGRARSLLDTNDEGEQRDPHSDDQRQEHEDHPSTDQPIGAQTLHRSRERVSACRLDGE